MAVSGYWVIRLLPSGYHGQNGKLSKTLEGAKQFETREDALAATHGMSATHTIGFIGDRTSKEDK